MQILAFCLLIVLLTSACSQTTAKPVAYTDTSTRGVRVYDPLPLLVVTCTNTQLVFVPNFEKGYAVQFTAVLSKNESTVKVQEGVLTELTAKLDSTGFLSLLQAWGEKALGAAKDLAALGASVQGALPGMEGVWRLDFDPKGTFTGMTRIKAATVPCAPADGAPPPPPAPKKPPPPGPKVDFP